MMDIKNKLGPILAKHQKQVTPGHLVSLKKLRVPLIKIGCNQLVLQSKKISVGLMQLVQENSLLIAEGTSSIQLPCVVDDAREHIMACAAGMRALKNEGLAGASTYTGMASALKNKIWLPTSPTRKAI